MSVNDIKKKIIDDAKEESEAQLKKAQEEKEAILNDLDAEKKKTEKDKEKEIEQQKQRNQEKIKSSAISEAKMRKTKMKREVLNKVFNKALEKLERMEESEFKNFVANKLKNSDMKEGKIIVPPKREEATNSVIDGQKNISIEVKENSGDGFMLENDDLFYDFTFKNILKDKLKEDESDIVKIAFPENEEDI